MIIINDIYMIMNGVGEMTIYVCGAAAIKLDVDYPPSPPALCVCVCVSANIHLPQYISFSPHAIPMLMVKSLMVDGHR